MVWNIPCSQSHAGLKVGVLARNMPCSPWHASTPATLPCFGMEYTPCPAAPGRIHWAPECPEAYLRSAPGAPLPPEGYPRAASTATFAPRSQLPAPSPSPGPPASAHLSVLAFRLGRGPPPSPSPLPRRRGGSAPDLLPPPPFLRSHPGCGRQPCGPVTTDLPSTNIDREPRVAARALLPAQHQSTKPMILSCHPPSCSSFDGAGPGSP